MTALIDNAKWLTKYKILVNFGMCFIMFILGLSQCTGVGGIHIDTVLNLILVVTKDWAGQ